LIAAEGMGERATLSPELFDWVQQFNPAIIYTHLGGLSYLRLTRKLAAATGARVVIHIMDDWAESKYRTGMLAPYFRARMKRELRTATKTAAACLAISPAMAREYERRYARKFETYSNALDLERWMPYARRDWSVSSPARLGYAGAIISNSQADSLRDICDATSLLNAAGLPCELHIRSASPIALQYSRKPHVCVGGALDDSEVGKFLSSMDVLLLPVNFDSASATYIRFSNPTKLPAYMISGTPILAYGPRGVDQIERAIADGWGMTLTRRDPAALADCLRRLVEDIPLREKLGRRAQEVARRDHDLAIVNPAFQAVIASATGSRS
jgi:glycosyltransferase involved in cell wall biosynthesis